jgi:hypothetical protein
MALESDVHQLIAAWRALDGVDDGGSGWRTIGVSGADSPVRAGRSFPGNHEALLVGFNALPASVSEDLPSGRGFEVERVDVKTATGRVWIALRRNSSGSPELFAMMAGDVLGLLATQGSLDDGPRLRAFIARIRAWQDFMRSPGSGPLGSEAEIGLVGELEVLERLLEAGVSARQVVDAWKGPLKELHDFVFVRGSMEVKACTGGIRFLASVACLEQLDDTLRAPLFMAAVRLDVEPSGRTLTQRVASLRTTLAADTTAQTMFGSLLLHAGFSDQHGESYSRRWRQTSLRVLPVDERFPRLTRATAPAAIVEASYVVDVDREPIRAVEMSAVLLELGVTRE